MFHLCVVKIFLELPLTLKQMKCHSDFPRRHAANQIVGTLWGLCHEASERDDGSIDIFDEDAIAYAR